MKHDSEKSAKHDYHNPQVFDYGNINQITEAVAMSGKTGDGGTGQMNKTQ